MNNANAKKEYKEKFITQTEKTNGIPVRSTKGSLLVRSISFSSSTEMYTFVSTCPRRIYKNQHICVQNGT